MLHVVLITKKPWFRVNWTDARDNDILDVWDDAIQQAGRLRSC